jgi:hypothetical protein
MTWGTSSTMSGAAASPPPASSLATIWIMVDLPSMVRASYSLASDLSLRGAGWWCVCGGRPGQGEAGGGWGGVGVWRGA